MRSYFGYQCRVCMILEEFQKSGVRLFLVLILRKRNKKLEERDLLSLLGFSVTECELEHAFLPTSSLIHMTTSTSYKRKGNALVPSDCSFIAISNGMLLLGNHCTQTSYLEDCVSIAGIGIM